MKKQEELGAVIILRIAKENRPEINALLLRNGVSLPSEASNLQVAQVTTELLKKSKTFKNEFLQLMANSQVLIDMANEYSNADGDDKPKTTFSQYNVSDTIGGTVKPLYLNTPLTPTSSSSFTDTSSSSGKSFLDKVLGIGEFGVNSFLKYNQNVTDQKLAEASIAQAQSGGGLAGYGNVNPNNEEGMGTGTIVFLTLLGFVVVGGVTWWYIKSQKTVK